eukprot:5681802-Heterocapsa_arctica.AAC.1
MTRVKGREDLLIYRPFEHSLFTQGPPEGPELLLRKLRGEAIDWDAIAEKYTPHRRCIVCDHMRFKDEFALSQWNRKDHRHQCA